MTNHKRKIGISVLVIVVIAIAGYFSFSTNTIEKIVGKEVKLTIGIGTLNPYIAPVLVAENKGFFKEEGLDVEIKEFGSGVVALTAMLEKGSPNIVIPTSLPVVFKSFDSENYAIFASIGNSDDTSKLLVREDRGIKVPADLKGKKIGTIQGTTAHYFLGRFLNANKLKISDVEVVNLKVTDLPKALADGQVDAISAWEPYVENAKKIIGIDAIVFPSKGTLHENFYSVARKDFIKNNSDALVKFLEAVVKGNKFLKEHPLESIDIVSIKAKMDKVTLVSQWDDYEFGLYLDRSIPATLEEQANWAVENKLVSGGMIPDYRNYVDDRIISKVKPEAVKLNK